MSPTEQIGKIVRTATMHAEADSEILQAAAFSKAMAKQRKHGNRVYLRDRAAEEGGKKITSGRSLVCGGTLCWTSAGALGPPSPAWRLFLRVKVALVHVPLPAVAGMVKKVLKIQQAWRQYKSRLLWDYVRYVCTEGQPALPCPTWFDDTTSR